jgi:hypothetical protein
MLPSVACVLLLLGLATVFAHGPHMNDLEFVRHDRIRLGLTDASLSLNVTSGVNDGDFVNVVISNPNPTNDDWLGMYTSSAKVTYTKPLKYTYMRFCQKPWTGAFSE